MEVASNERPWKNLHTGRDSGIPHGVQPDSLELYRKRQTQSVQTWKFLSSDQRIT